MSTTDFSRFIRPHLQQLERFSPADPPEEQARRAGIPEEEIIRLNANENPYGPSLKVAQAVAQVDYSIYPDPEQRRVRGAISDFTGVPTERLIVGAGSDEIIDLVFRLVMELGDQIIDSDPTFGMYRFDAAVNGVETILTQRDDAFELDVDAIASAIGEQTKMIFVCSPNNPTGNVASPEQISALIDTGLLVVVDEAYWEFSQQTVVPMTYDHDNLIVLRTLSKWGGIAGLRAGFGIMSPEIISRLFGMKQPYNITTATEAAVIASFQDADYLNDNARKIVSERERMTSLLTEIEGLEPLPSGGNYVLCRVAGDRAKPIFHDLAARGIFLRNFSSPRLRDYFRISVGKPHETDIVITALKELV